MWRRKRHMHGGTKGPTVEAVGGVGSRERTLNMARMVVTPEVSQLDKPALKFGVS